MLIPNRKFYLYFITFHIIIKVYAVTFLPGAPTLRGYINILDLFLLSIYFILALDIKNLLLINFNFNINIVLILLTLILFLYSSLYINFKSNFNFLDLIKILNYILHFLVFFILFPKIIEVKSNNFEVFLTGILVFVLINSIFSLLSLHTGFNQYRALRSSVGLYMNPNATAFIFTIGIPILFYKYWNNKIKIIFFIPFLLVLLYCDVFTLSRGGFIGLLVSLMILFYSKSRKFFIFSLIVISFLIFTFFFDLIALKTDSSLARGIIIYTVIQMATSSLSNFMWGYGVTRATEVLFDEKQLYGNFEVNVNNPHNFVLLLLIQFGALVTISYLLFLGSIIANSAKKLKDKLPLEISNRIKLLISLISGLIVQNLFEEIIIVPDFPLFAFSLIILGLLYNTLNQKTFICDEKRI